MAGNHGELNHPMSTFAREGTARMCGLSPFSQKAQGAQVTKKVEHCATDSLIHSSPVSVNQWIMMPRPNESLLPGCEGARVRGCRDGGIKVARNPEWHANASFQTPPPLNFLLESFGCGSLPELLSSCVFRAECVDIITC